MMIDLRLGDCLEVIKTLPDKSVDMVLCDPPYLTDVVDGGMFRTRRYGQEIKDLDIHRGFDIGSFYDLILPKFKDPKFFNGVFFCSRRQIFEYLKLANLAKLQFGISVWHKSNPAPVCNNTYLNDLEFIIYLKGKNARILGNYFSKSLVYKSTTNQADKKLYGHPTIKPIPLMEKYIINHSKPGETILDPFMGSGSTGVAAKNLGRSFIGIERDTEYFEIAKRRIENAKPDAKKPDPQLEFPA